MAPASHGHSQSMNSQAISIVQGDITTFAADAMGNAANSLLAGGGGVDGAIHQAAGPKLLDELKQKYSQGTPPGTAVTTKAYGRLKVKWVIHAVGPIWRGGKEDEANILQATYHNSYLQAEKLKCRTIVMPAISCGIYGFPHQKAAEIAIKATNDFLKQATSLKEVTFVIYSKKLLGIFQSCSRS